MLLEVMENIDVQDFRNLISIRLHRGLTNSRKAHTMRCFILSMVSFLALGFATRRDVQPEVNLQDEGWRASIPNWFC